MANIDYTQHRFEQKNDWIAMYLKDGNLESIIEVYYEIGIHILPGIITLIQGYDDEHPEVYKYNKDIDNYVLEQTNDDGESCGKRGRSS